MRFKQSGDEFGLFAYFPFERYTEDQFGQFVLTETLTDESDKTVSGLNKVVSTLVNGATFTNATTAINIARPVQAVNFTYVINNDEIIITPTDPSGRIENTQLDITVGGLLDLNGNEMASPVTWSAYIDQNQVHWLDQRQTSNIFTEEDYQFTAVIINEGGENAGFTIQDLPNWLKASPSSGSVAPLSRETITFSVNAGLPIGHYQENLLLSTDFGFDEVLQLDLTVAAQAPNWIVNEADFEFSMNLVAQVSIDNILSSDENDLVAAFINGEIRGIASISDLSNGRFLVIMSVFSNSLTPQNIEFRIFDADKGNVLSAEADPKIVFVNGGIAGGLSNPVILSVVDKILFTYDLRKGWNWVSFPMVFADSSLENVLTDLAPSNNDVVKGFESFAQYDQSFGWNGSLSSINGFEGYRVYVNKASSFEVVGVPINVSNGVSISKGWNWISFLPTARQTVTQALAGYPSEDGDIIKNQSSFAIYDGGTDRWIGTLNYMKPGGSYQLLSGGTSELFYNNTSIATARIEASVPQIDLRNEAEFSSNMSVIISSNAAPDFELLAYHKDELRGRTHSVDGKYYLTVHGDSETEAIDFKFASVEKEIEVAKQMDFISDGVEFMNLDINTELVSLSAFPSPFESTLQVEYKAVKSGELTISLYSVEGVKLETVFDGEVNLGIHSFSHQSELVNGVYLLISELDGVRNIKQVVK